MKCELVYAGDDTVNIPSAWSKPRQDQFHGTNAERLIELCGRGCYDSLGTGRGSLEYHQHLVEVKHYSVHEHFHFTIETDLNPIVWLGIPDVSVDVSPTGRTRLTANLRHCIEWPKACSPLASRNYLLTIEEWSRTLAEVKHFFMPNVFPRQTRLNSAYSAPWSWVEPKTDREAFISLFLEDSRVWSHEQVRHRFNISQRSGRFCDETDREDCIHPLLRDYLNEAGYLALNQEDGEKLWCENNVSDPECAKRTKLGNHIGSLLTQQKMVYSSVVEDLQPWIIEKTGLSKTDARKQARSAARYYLGNGLSTEMIFTTSIYHWRDIFNQRCSIKADRAINDLMEAAQSVIRNSRYGHLL